MASMDNHPGLSSRLCRELVRCATLAASSHNSQPWKFRLEPNGVAILPDWSRRCPVVDPDDHHLYTSLGCAAENLVQAAAAQGYRGVTEFDVTRETIHVRLEPSRVSDSTSLQAIEARQCSRTDYESRSVPQEHLRALERVAEGSGVRVLILTDKAQLEGIAEFVRQGNCLQTSDPKWLEELRTWLRYNECEAMRRRDGLHSKAIGAPSVPKWMGDRIFSYVVTPKMQNRVDVPRVRCCAGIAVFVSESDNRGHWIEVGRSYQRFALLATTLGIRNAFMNQPVEVATLRSQLAQWLNLGRMRPDLLVRFGYGPNLARSFRRELVDVIDSSC